MAPTSVSKVFADLDRRERALRRAFDLNPMVEMFDIQKKIAGHPNIDLLASDAANMLLARVAEPPATMALLDKAGPFMDLATRVVPDLSEERGIARVLKQREELEAKLARATGSGVVMHELGHSFLPEMASDPPGLIAAPPATATAFVADRPPVVAPQRRPIAPAKPTIVPSDLAELSAGAEARSNRIAVEAMLRDNDLDLELEHLKVIAVRLVSGSDPDRVHAAMSASLLFSGIADHVFPGREEKYVDRNKKKRSVEKKDHRNRISAYIDMHLRGEISTHDARRLQAKIDYAHTWSAEGHHVAYSPELAVRAYRDLLEVLAYVARARERSLQVRWPG
jgi:hypothetical protein